MGTVSGAGTPAPSTTTTDHAVPPIGPGAIPAQRRDIVAGHDVTEYVEQIVAAAPPFTPSQLARIAAILDSVTPGDDR